MGFRIGVNLQKSLRSGGIEPPSNAWKASMLTITPRTLTSLAILVEEEMLGVGVENNRFLIMMFIAIIHCVALYLFLHMNSR